MQTRFAFFDVDSDFYKFLMEESALDDRHIFILIAYALTVSLYLWRRSTSRTLTYQERADAIGLKENETQLYQCVICYNIASDPVCSSHNAVQTYCRSCLLPINRDPFTAEILHLDDIVSLPLVERNIKQFIQNAEENYRNSSILRLMKYNWKKLSSKHLLYYFLIYSLPVTINSGYATTRDYSFESTPKIHTRYREFSNDNCPTLMLEDIYNIISDGSAFSINAQQSAICARMTFQTQFGDKSYPHNSEQIAFLLENFSSYGISTAKSDALKHIESIPVELIPKQQGILRENKLICHYMVGTSSIRLNAMYKSVFEKLLSPRKLDTLCPLINPVCPTIKFDDALNIASNGIGITNPNYTLAREVRNYIESLEPTANPYDTFYRLCINIPFKTAPMYFFYRGLLASSEKEAQDRVTQFLGSIKEDYNSNGLLRRTTPYQSYFTCEYLNGHFHKNHSAYKSNYESINLFGLFKPKHSALPNATENSLSGCDKQLFIK